MTDQESQEQISENEMFDLMKRLAVTEGDKITKNMGNSQVVNATKHEDYSATKDDKESNRIILEGILSAFPDHGIISEESPSLNLDNKYTWIIDPIDGTRNFRYGVPQYSVLIGLAKHGEMIAAAVYIPALKNLYSAQRGKGAFKNELRISCSKMMDLNNTTGVGFLNIYGPYKPQIRKLSEASDALNFKVREYGSGAFDMMMVSEGTNDWYFMPTHGGGVWDNAAPSIILSEAGNRVVNFKGENWTTADKTEIIAGPPKVVDHIFSIIN